jgi:hypothetical protein
VKKISVAIMSVLMFLLYTCLLPVNRTMAQPAEAPTPSGIKASLSGLERAQAIFSRTGAVIEGYGVYGFAETGRDFLEIDRLREMAYSLNRTLSIQNPRTYHMQDGSQNLYQLYGEGNPGTQISLVLTSTHFPGQPPQTTVVIRAEKSSSDLADLVAYVQRVQDTLRQASGTPQISTCIKGFSNDRMVTMGRNDLFSRIFNDWPMEDQETIRSGEMMILSGVFPRSGDSARMGGQREKIQVILRDDASRRGTWILVGSPIVSTE